MPNHDPPTNYRNHAGCNNSSKFMLPKGITIVPKSSILSESLSSSKRVKRSRNVASPIVITMPKLEFERRNKIVISATE
ncbi:hypothetical protein H5410_056702 [Solanum commersonii]|uniref:Uncharacterized protein n=1 Tax=Solanum commersonii TaxID=4109 RepID=A0A9J5WNG6_SOLCO|nr:hypothetical protein H5410_056702 [Solanum commersonii]